MHRFLFWKGPPCACGEPFAIEFGCTMPLSDYICTATVTASKTRRFVIETVSFSGQAASGQTVGADFWFRTGGTKAFVWLPVNSYGPSPSAGTGVYVATLAVLLRVDPDSPITLEVSRNSSANAGRGTPYSQRLSLMGYLE